MIAAANLQPEAAQELDFTHDSEDEEPAVLAETHDAASNELEEDVDLGAPEDEAGEEEEEEIPLEEVKYNVITARSLWFIVSAQLNILFVYIYLNRHTWFQLVVFKICAFGLLEMCNNTLGKDLEKYFSLVFQETIAPVEEKSSPAEISAPVKEPTEAAAPTLPQTGVSLSISKGSNLFPQHLVP